MKRIAILSSIALVFFTVHSSGQNISIKSQGAYLVAKPDTVRMGEILLDNLSSESGRVEVLILNEGTRPLIVNNVSSCCGTNVKEWPRQPILPGKSGVVQIEFRIEPKPQLISRSVTIVSNAVNAKSIRIPIEGIVIEGKKPNEITL